MEIEIKDKNELLFAVRHGLVSVEEGGKKLDREKAVSAIERAIKTRRIDGIGGEEVTSALKRILGINKYKAKSNRSIERVVNIRGRIGEKRKEESEDVILIKRGEVSIVAAIDGVSMSIGGRLAAEEWESVLSNIEVERSELEGEDASIAIKIIAARIKEKAHDIELLRNAVFTASFSFEDRKEGAFRHLIMWNGDGGACLVENGAVKSLDARIVKNLPMSCPLDIIKHSSPTGNIVVSNRLWERTINLEGLTFGEIRDGGLPYYEIRGRGNLLVYTDGITDACFGYMLKESKLLKEDIDWNKKKSYYKEFMVKLASGEIDKEEIFHLVEMNNKPVIDDISYGLLSF
ncbi:MAG: hypothetical protein D6769_03855 [Methanobacteriota archaeon]|nr:MAG: hypothetical protein D6769_03855 [Euryarchaeota archaeon]